MHTALITCYSDVTLSSLLFPLSAGITILYFSLIKLDDGMLNITSCNFTRSNNETENVYIYFTLFSLAGGEITFNEVLISNIGLRSTYNSSSKNPQSFLRILLFPLLYNRQRHIQ